ncbi:MAG: type II toxin-antitoxin system PrlF family antitoxin [Desulfobacteraceae bacterium]|jgi:bifunctional DNA-binding transcriptional regulator/antitoxin component of YhaV-PrlF toxin-antitoxin module|nr:type II toxin-antitoxin system PrlF family antitoxin [Desulfobacteraceae bacterium]
MQSVITSKYQTTIPKSIRLQLKLSVSDTLEWKIKNGKAVVLPVHRKFLEYRNVVKTGKGDIANDIDRARKDRAEKHR